MLALRSLAVVALAAPALAQTQWTVDADGPSDFDDVAAAVASVAPGDVLLIQPGDYGPVVLTQRLSLLGDPGGERPRIASLAIDGAPGFTLAHLELGATTITGALGPSRVGECAFTGQQQFAALRVTDSGPLVVHGTTVAPPLLVPDGAAAVVVAGQSVVAIADSTLTGGDAADDSFQLLAGYGGNGLIVTDESVVLLSGSTVVGGGGEDAPLFFFPFVDPGRGGDAVRASDTAAVEIRGSVDDLLQGGPQNYFFPEAGPDGAAVFTFGQATVVYSGVSTDGFVDLDAVEQTPPAPHVYVRGSSEPGTTKRASFHGPAGEVGVLVLSFAPSLSSTPGVQGTLWLNPGAIAQLVPLALVGQDDAATHNWTLPTDPALAGLVAIVQGVVLDDAGPLVATNPALIVLGF